MQIDTQQSEPNTKELVRMENALVESNIKVMEEDKLCDTFVEASKMLCHSLDQQTNVQNIRDKLPSQN